MRPRGVTDAQTLSSRQALGKIDLKRGRRYQPAGLAQAKPNQLRNAGCPALRDTRYQHISEIGWQERISFCGIDDERLSEGDLGVEEQRKLLDQFLWGPSLDDGTNRVRVRTCQTNALQELQAPWASTTSTYPVLSRSRAARDNLPSDALQVSARGTDIE